MGRVREGRQPGLKHKLSWQNLARQRDVSLPRTFGNRKPTGRAKDGHKIMDHFTIPLFDDFASEIDDALESIVWDLCGRQERRGVIREERKA